MNMHTDRSFSGKDPIEDKANQFIRSKIDRQIVPPPMLTEITEAANAKDQLKKTIIAILKNKQLEQELGDLSFPLRLENETLTNYYRRINEKCKSISEPAKLAALKQEELRMKQEESSHVASVNDLKPLITALLNRINKALRGDPEIIGLLSNDERRELRHNENDLKDIQSNIGSFGPAELQDARKRIQDIQQEVSKALDPAEKAFQKTDEQTIRAEGVKVLEKGIVASIEAINRALVRDQSATTRAELARYVEELKALRSQIRSNKKTMDEYRKQLNAINLMAGRFVPSLSQDVGSSISKLQSYVSKEKDMGILLHDERDDIRAFKTPLHIAVSLFHQAQDQAAKELCRNLIGEIIKKGADLSNRTLSSRASAAHQQYFRQMTRTANWWKELEEAAPKQDRAKIKKAVEKDTREEQDREAKRAAEVHHAVTNAFALQSKPHSHSGRDSGQLRERAVHHVVYAVQPPMMTDEQNRKKYDSVIAKLKGAIPAEGGNHDWALLERIYDVVDLHLTREGQETDEQYYERLSQQKDAIANKIGDPNKFFEDQMKELRQQEKDCLAEIDRIIKSIESEQRNKGASVKSKSAVLEAHISKLRDLQAVSHKLSDAITSVSRFGRSVRAARTELEEFENRAAKIKASAALLVPGLAAQTEATARSDIRKRADNKNNLKQAVMHSIEEVQLMLKKSKKGLFTSERELFLKSRLKSLQDLMVHAEESPFSPVEARKLSEAQQRERASEKLQGLSLELDTIRLSMHLKDDMNTEVKRCLALIEDALKQYKGKRTSKAKNSDVEFLEQQKNRFTELQNKTEKTRGEDVRALQRLQKDMEVAKSVAAEVVAKLRPSQRAVVSERQVNRQPRNPS